MAVEIHDAVPPPPLQRQRRPEQVAALTTQQHHELAPRRATSPDPIRQLHRVRRHPHRVEHPVPRLPPPPVIPRRRHTPRIHSPDPPQEPLIPHRPRQLVTPRHRPHHRRPQPQVGRPIHHHPPLPHHNPLTVSHPLIRLDPVGLRVRCQRTSLPPPSARRIHPRRPARQPGGVAPIVLQMLEVRVIARIVHASSLRRRGRRSPRCCRRASSQNCDAARLDGVARTGRHRRWMRAGLVVQSTPLARGLGWIGQLLDQSAWSSRGPRRMVRRHECAQAAPAPPPTSASARA